MKQGFVWLISGALLLGCQSRGTAAADCSEACEEMSTGADCSGDSRAECSKEVERLVAECVAECSSAKR